MAEDVKKTNGRRVYVTFLSDGSVAVQPSDCTGSKYSRLHEGIMLQEADRTDTKVIGGAVLKMRDKCKTD
jgi:hypothetical protein